MIMGMVPKKTRSLSGTLSQRSTITGLRNKGDSVCSIHLGDEICHQGTSCFMSSINSHFLLTSMLRVNVFSDTIKLILSISVFHEQYSK